MARRVPLAHRVEFLLFRAGVRVLRALPERWALEVGATLGWLAGSVARVRRRVADANLARAFPDRDRGWRDRVARASYRNLGREAVATFLFAGEPAARVLERTPEATGVDAMLDAVRAGRGLILVTGHLGNWEMAGGAAAARGAPLAAVSVRQANRLFDDALVASRASLGVSTIRRGNARREVLEALRAGRVVGLVADQDARERGVFVDFLGTPASTARGPALFALRSGAPLFLGLCVAVPGHPGRYRCEVEEVRFERSGDLDEDVRRLTAAHAAALAERVRREPEQYFWQHRRWRTPPPAGGVPEHD
jgi:KDO2-lipid IV(A) lauroyltransferase